MQYKDYPLLYSLVKKEEPKNEDEGLSYFFPDEENQEDEEGGIPYFFSGEKKPVVDNGSSLKDEELVDIAGSLEAKKLGDITKEQIENAKSELALKGNLIPYTKEQLKRSPSRGLASSQINPDDLKKSETKDDELKDLQLKAIMSLSGQLKSAQDYKRALAFSNVLGGATEKIAEGISAGYAPVGFKGAKADFSEQRKAMEKMAEQGEEDILTKFKATEVEKESEEKEQERERKERLRDPNSEESKMAQSIVKQTGIRGLENASAEIISKYLPTVANIFSARESREYKQALLEKQLEARKESAEAKGVKEEERHADKITQAVQKQITSGPYKQMYENYKVAERMGKAIEQFSKDPSGYTDYATLLGGLKTLQGDQSVVRETEIRMGMEAASLPTKISNWVNRLATGKSLSEEQRKEIRQAITIMSDIAKQQYISSTEHIVDYAVSRGADRKYLLEPSLRSEDEQVKKETPSQEPSTTTPSFRVPDKLKKPAAPGTIYRLKGSLYTVQEDGLTLKPTVE